MRGLGFLSLALLGLAGCGGGRTSAPEPRLPAPVASSLATYAEDAAALAAAGDACGAREQALALQRETIAAINAHRVPAPLQEPLQSAVNDLVHRLVCSPPPAQPTTGETDQGNSSGHGKDKRKPRKKDEE